MSNSWIWPTFFEFRKFISPVVFAKEFQTILWFLIGRILMKTIFKIKTYHLYSVRGNMLNCAKCLIVKNCENVNSVWLVLIRIWFRNLVWAEFFLIEPLMFNPPKFYRDHLKLQHFSRSVFNRKIFDNFVITIFIALTAWWTCGTSRVLFILSRISIIFHRFSRGIEILTC